MSNHINSGIYRCLNGGLFGDNYCKAKRLYTDVNIGVQGVQTR